MTFGNGGAVREVKAKEGVSEWRRGRCSRGQRQQTKTVTFRAKRLDGMGPVDKFVNYCGKPVTSEVAFGQTGCIACGQWMEGRQLAPLRAAGMAAPHRAAPYGSVGPTRSLPGNNFPRHSNCCTSVRVQHLGLLLFTQSLFSF